MIIWMTNIPSHALSDRIDQVMTLRETMGLTLMGNQQTLGFIVYNLM